MYKCQAFLSSNLQQPAFSTAMRSFFAYSLLVVQFVLFNLVGARKYNFGNEFTKFWIADNSVAVGQEIRTSYGFPNPPSNALSLTVGTLPVSSGSTLNSTIYDCKHDLYVGLTSTAGPGSRLVWLKDPYQWTFYRTYNSSYFIRSSNLYWFDNFSIPTVIEVDPYAYYYYWNVSLVA
ncbi:hypothetical protein AX15_001911 [Amanita polypyramis BW_CC]|nr:hypothetical protein AX15_001911 [Amanita polypyramis BW_CC]